MTYTAAQKKAYYAANPDKLAAKKARAAKAKAPPATRRAASKAIMSNQRYINYSSSLSSSRRTSLGGGLSSADLVRYMSPFGKTEPPLNTESLGNYLTYNSQGRLAITTSTTNQILVIYNPSIRGIYQVGAFNITAIESTSGVSISNSFDAAPLFKFKDNTDSPISYRPQRAAVKIQNLSSANNTSGLIKVFQTSSPLEYQYVDTFNMLPSVAWEFKNYVEKQATTVEYTARHFTDNAVEFVISPATITAYHSYGITPFMSNSVAYKPQQQADAAQIDMSMNAILILFDKVDAPNTYNLTFGLQNAFRFPANTIPNELQTAHNQVIGDRYTRFQASVQKALVAKGSAGSGSR